jgi:hypothetical protein
MEQVLDWLNENELRAYPLLEYAGKTLSTSTQTTWTIPDNFLLDLQLVCFSADLEQDKVLQSGETVKITSPIYLKKIIRASSNTVTVEFGTTSITLMTFTATVNNNAAYPIYVRTADGLAVFGAGIVSFSNTALINQAFTGSIPLEPSTYSQFNDAWLGVNSINTTPEKTTILASYKPSLPLQSISEANSTSLVGDITFIAGYNFRVAVSNNLIDLEISYGMGLKMDCTTSFLDPIYIDCESIVSYINGVPPDSAGNFFLKAGANVSISKGSNLNSFEDSYDEEANNNTLFVGLTFGSSDICGPVNITPSLL